MTRRASVEERPAVMAGRIAALVSGAIVCIRAELDPDFWGHLRFGLDLASSGRLTAVDPYSFTQDVPWVNHEWLSELLFAIAYRAGGVSGMIALKIVVLAAAFVVLAKIAVAAKSEFRGWLLAVAFINLAPIAITFRPQLWTILCLSLVCAILAGRLRWRWMPLVFAVWANMHGGWIVGGGVVTLWLLGRVLDTRSLLPQVRPAMWLALSGLATIVNPYGWRLWSFILATVRLSRPDIIEWRPYWERFEVTLLVFLPLAIAVFAVTVVGRWRHVSWARLFPAIWLGVNGVFVSRLAPLFALLALFMAAEAWASEESASSDGQDRAPWRQPARLIDAFVVVVAVWSFLTAEIRCLAISPEWGPDLVAASALTPDDVRGRLIVPFDWGEYTLWHFGPRLKVSTDGRRETIYSEATIKQQFAVAFGQPEGLAFLASAKPEYAWIRDTKEGPLATWLMNNGYVMDVTTTRSRIARRADLPPLHVSTPMSSCAP